MTIESAFDRRRALLLLAGLAAPSLARAQTLPQITLPTRPLMPTISPPLPSRPLSALTTVIDRSKIYYVIFDQPLDIPATRALRRQLTVLVEAGVSEINLVLSSTGGLLMPTLVLYSLIRALPAKINTHAQGFVASAATILFLAGQERSADRNARFLFHPSQSTLLGTLNEAQIQDQLAQFGDLEGAVAQIYRDRTKLSDDDIKQFQHETVIFDAEKAQKFDIIQTIADLRIEGDQKAKILFIE